MRRLQVEGDALTAILVAGPARGEARFNRVSNVSRLRERWGSSPIAKADSLSNRNGPDGRINAMGTRECGDALILTPADLRFLENVEVGVRELVRVLVQDLFCMTYTSCEGHPPSEDSKLIERHVGILPRDSLEAKLLVDFLKPLVRSESDSSQKGRLAVALFEGTLEDEDGAYSCIDIVFTASTDNWEIYKPSLDQSYAELLFKLGRAIAAVD